MEEYERPTIADRAEVGDPLIVGYPSPRWRSSDAKTTERSANPGGENKTDED